MVILFLGLYPRLPMQTIVQYSRKVSSKMIQKLILTPFFSIHE